jgi:molecular chaperone GrpE
MRSWYENEELIKRFREWLGRTESEIAALGYDGAFQDSAAEDLPDVGMIQLIEAFTALRHEIKLQTKGSRGLEDALQEALAGLEEAAEQMRSVDTREAEAVARAARPLVEALIDLDEALERGLRAAHAAHANVLEDTLQRHEQAAQQRFAQLSFWQRRKARAWFDISAKLFRQQMTDLHRRIILPLLEGYQLIYARLERTLTQLDIERIECLGDPVDPNEMTVVELVDDPDAEPETVVEIVRPGYLWLGRLIRYAEVRAVRQIAGGRKEQDRDFETDEDELDREQEPPVGVTASVEDEVWRDEPPQPAAEPPSEEPPYREQDSSDNRGSPAPSLPADRPAPDASPNNQHH